MTADRTDEFATLAEATRGALVEVGPELFESPQRLVAFLLDSADSKSPAVRMLSYNCDEEMLAPFAEVLKEQREPVDCSEVVLEKAARLLYDERVVAEDPARAATRDLAQGIALSHGMDIQDPSPLAQAIYEVVDGRDAWTLLTTQLTEFFGRVSSLIGRTPEVRVLEYNCDTAYLTLLFSAFSGSDDTPERLSLATSRVVQILVNDRAISEETACLAINQLAEGIANYLGTTLSQPSKPSFSTQDSSMTGSTLPSSAFEPASLMQASLESASTPYAEQASSIPSVVPSFSSSAGALSASAGVPSASVGAPLPPAGTPSASAVPSASAGVPSASVGAPLPSAGAPSSSLGIPSASAGTPSVYAVPSVSAGTPSAYAVPSASADVPSTSMGVLSASAGTPLASSTSAVPSLSGEPSVSSVPSSSPAGSSPVIYGTSAYKGDHFTYQFLFDARMPETVSLNGEISVEEIAVSLSKVQLRITNTGTSAVFITKAVAIGTYTSTKVSFSVPYQTAPSTEFVAPASNLTMTFKAKLSDLWTRTERHYEISGYVQPLDVSFLKYSGARFSRPLTSFSVRAVESVISNSRIDLTITNIGNRSICLKRVVANAKEKNGENWKVACKNSQITGTIRPGTSRTLSFNAMVTQRWIAATRHYDITGYEE